MDIDSFNMYTVLFSKAPPNILLSYGRRNNSYSHLIEKQVKGEVNIVLDAGTYTANNSKKDNSQKINFGGYKSFVDNLNNYFDFIFAYDINFQKNKWKDNLKYLAVSKDIGLKNIVPVIHSYTEKEIKTYLDMGYKLIALGYSKEYKTEENISKCANLIYKNNAKVHLLGKTTENILKTNPISYCDSSNWVQYSWDRKVIYTDQDTGETKYFKHIKSSPPKTEEVDKFKRYLKQIIGDRITIEDVFQKRKLFRNVLNMHYYINLEKEINEHKAKNG